MANSLYQFNKFQIGRESTKGTLVAATRVLPLDGSLTEEQDYYRSQYPFGYRANVGGLGVITRKGSLLKMGGDLNSVDPLWMMQTGVLGQVAAVGAGSAKTWTFTPPLTTGVPTIDAATVEIGRTDGVTQHYYGEVGYAMTSKFGFEWAFNQNPKYTWEMFARTRQSGTITAALTPYTVRKELVDALLLVYLDTTAAGLGGTQLTGVMRHTKLEVETGYAPNYSSDGRSDLDFVDHKVGNIKAKLSLLLELDAVGAARWTEYRNNTPGLFVRLKNTGDAISGGGNHTVQVDGAWRFIAPPAEQRDGEDMLIACELESYVDATWTKTLEFVLINEQATL